MAYSYKSLPPYLEDAISLKVNTTLLMKSGDWITVSWKSVPDPATTDWIGVYSPPVNQTTIDLVKHAPTKYQVNEKAHADHTLVGNHSLVLWCLEQEVNSWYTLYARVQMFCVSLFSDILTTM